MGDKVMARQLAGEASLPLVPGTEGEISDADAPEEAQRIGYPIMVKAADGGGGIGIRRVDSPEELESALERSRSLAQGSFGSNRMYLERLIAPVAHVEVQVMADHYGNVIHLFERDCSMQRRNQKVIEESPTARLTTKTRDKLHKSAVNLVKHIGYTNAGTVEFLVDQSGDFYFLEMNTRLQVEHPVTEMITNLDLVELQLLVAANERLPVNQSQIQSNGHSIEIRLYPEDPATLMPVAGTVAHLDIPTAAYIRLDSALFEGYEVTPHYESMLGKFIVWGENRKQAISRMYEALGILQIEGLITNIPALRAALLTEQFIQGIYTTDLFSQVVSEYQEANSKEGKLRTATLAIVTALEKLIESKVDFGSKRVPLQSDKRNWRQASRREQLRPTYFRNEWRRS
jgi:acetyl-CoA carboxylase biotin carboxylase subunit